MRKKRTVTIVCYPYSGNPGPTVCEPSLKSSRSFVVQVRQDGGIYVDNAYYPYHAISRFDFSGPWTEAEGTYKSEPVADDE